MEWQPIESAPRDGSPFLIWDGRELGVGMILPKSYAGIPFASMRAAWISDRDEDWNIYLGGKEVTDATHWMPLPAPPEA